MATKKKRPPVEEADYRGRRKRGKGRTPRLQIIAKKILKKVAK
jgi:hypothetical protein